MVCVTGLFTGCVPPSPGLLVVCVTGLLTGCVPLSPGLLVVCVTGLPVVSDTAETVVDDGVVGAFVDIFVDTFVGIVVSLTVWEIIWLGGDVVCGGSEEVETEGVEEEVILVSVAGVAVPVVMRNMI